MCFFCTYSLLPPLQRLAKVATHEPWRIGPIWTWEKEMSEILTSFTSFSTLYSHLSRRFVHFVRSSPYLKHFIHFFHFISLQACQWTRKRKWSPGVIWPPDNLRVHLKSKVSGVYTSFWLSFWLSVQIHYMLLLRMVHLRSRLTDRSFTYGINRSH